MESHQFIQWAFMLALSAGAAWGGAKYAIKSHERMIMELQKKVEKLVPLSFCKDERGNCRIEKTHATGEISKKIDKLFEMIEDQSKAREEDNKERNAITLEITKTLSDLEATIRERENRYRASDGSSRR